MSEFVCRVADADGRVFSHVEAANTLDEARQKLAERGLFVYSVEARGGRVGSLLRRRTGRQIGGSDFLILNQQFNTLIKAGLPILRALDLLATRASSARSLSRSGITSGKGSPSPKQLTKRASFPKFIQPLFWRERRAETCQASWTTTLLINA